MIRLSSFLSILSTVTLVAVVSFGSSSTWTTMATPLPNIVFVLSDDLGYNAPGYRNPQLVTPTLDALANDGVILDAHYTYKFCSPSRASFLSGRYPFKTEGTRNNLIPFRYVKIKRYIVTTVITGDIFFVSIRRVIRILFSPSLVHLIFLSSLLYLTVKKTV